MIEASADDLIAVIGLAAKVPGAASIDEFWQELVEGREAVRFLGDDELLAAGVPAERLAKDSYVRAVAEVGDLSMFDAGLFGFTPREAVNTDPQIRLFLEVCHTAVENAGYDPRRIPGSTGVFGSMGGNLYSQLWLNASDRSLGASRIATSVLNMPDYLSTQVSYKFGLRGPSMTVHSACSSSLVAVHLAAQALRLGECDAAIAGGVDIVFPVSQGYLWDEGSPLSQDGHCRPFDAAAKGTVFGSGAGAVLLKRFGDALADGDQISAVLRGSAVNNDGNSKVGFTAPGVSGQADVIREAMLMAGRAPADISYIEAHSTGTSLGDPIEFTALTRAYRSLSEADSQSGADSGSPRIPVSSVKGNIGHLGHAAGIASFIKVVLSLVNEVRPPTVNFTAPNPQLNLADSPFTITTDPVPWLRDDERPRTAALSALGFGGTNCHMVLEEGPLPRRSTSAARPEVLVWSARDETAADEYRSRLAAHFAGAGAVEFPDVVATMQDGRTPHRHRRAVVVSTAAEAVAAIADERVTSNAARSAAAEHTVWTGADKKPPIIAFAFPGQAAQQPAMALGLYGVDPAFSAAMDECLELFAEHEPVLAQLWRTADEVRIRDTRLAQPLLFSVEYALARRWLAAGVVPDVIVGHSVGELVAATVAGVFTLDEAVRVVAARSAAMAATPDGGMLALGADVDEVERLLPDGVSIAVVNGPKQVVVACGPDRLAEAAGTFREAGISTRELPVSRAFHSPLMRAAVDRFAAAFTDVELREPAITMISASGGGLVTSAEAKDPNFWARQITGPVRFDRATATLLQTLAEHPAGLRRIMLEVGPGQTLTRLLQQDRAVRDAELVVVASMPRSSGDAERDQRAAATAAARLWTSGIGLEWSAFRSGRRARIPAPGYPYQRERYWPDVPVLAAQPRDAPVISPEKTPVPARDEAARSGSPFGIPTWTEQPLPPGPARPGATALVLLPSAAPSANRLTLALRQAGHKLVLVQFGDVYDDTDRHLTVRRGQAGDLDRLVETLARRGVHPASYVHALGLADWGEATLGNIDDQLADGVHSLVALARCAAAHPVSGTSPILLTVMTKGVDVSGGEPLEPAKAALTGVVRTLAAESAELDARIIDISDPVAEDGLVGELRAAGTVLVALRGASRWVPGERSIELAESPPPLRRGGTYILVGGLGGLGRSVARAMADTGRRPNLVLVGRFDRRAAGHPAAAAIEADLEYLRGAGAEVEIVACDITDRRAVRRLADGLRARGRSVSGIVNLAGVAGDGMLLVRPETAVDAVLRPKVHGSLVLAETFGRDTELDFLVSFSSRAALDGLVGGGDYSAANVFLDAHMRLLARRGLPAQSINWPAWHTVGMAVERGEQPPPPNTVDWTVTVDPATEPILDEHRVAGIPVMPGTGHLDLAITGFRTVIGPPKVPVRLDDVVFRQVLSSTGSRELRFRYVPDGDEWRWEASSVPAGSGSRVVHATGRIARLREQPPYVPPLSVLREQVTAPEVTSAPAASKLFNLGPRWNTVVRATSGKTKDGERQRLLELALPDAFAGEVSGHAMHPSLLDSCTAAARDSSVAGAYVPFHYGTLRCYGDLPARVISNVVRRPAGAGMLVADVTIYAPDGALLATVERFVMRGVEPGFFTESAERGDAGSTVSAERAADQKTGIAPEDGGLLLLRLLGHTRCPQVTVRPYVDGQPLPVSGASPMAAPMPVARVPVAAPAPAPASPAATTAASDQDGSGQDSMENRLAALWTEVLGIQTIESDDDFFELGGDSLVAVELIGRVRSELGVATSIVAVFENPTLSGLAASLADKGER